MEMILFIFYQDNSFNMIIYGKDKNYKNIETIYAVDDLSEKELRQKVNAFLKIHRLTKTVSCFYVESAKTPHYNLIIFLLLALYDNQQNWTKFLYLADKYIDNKFLLKLLKKVDKRYSELVATILFGNYKFKNLNINKYFLYKYGDRIIRVDGSFIKEFTYQTKKMQEEALKQDINNKKYFI